MVLEQRAHFISEAAIASRDINTESSEESGFLLNEKQSKDFWRDSERGPSKPLWTVIVLLAAVALASIATNLWQWSHYQETFKTDLPDARRAIQYEQRTYTGALVYDSETVRAIRVQDAPIEYFGPPGEEIDAAWGELLKGNMQDREPQTSAPLTILSRRIYIHD
jgi:hypothetical protein